MRQDAPYVLRPATRQTLGANVAESLREAIFGGVFKPGQRLAEAPIASTLKVSRAPVREALASLEQEGLVSRASNRGGGGPRGSAGRHHGDQPVGEGCRGNLQPPPCD
jgi:DNA-binding GntR family transcriptional regulator